eukprot:Gb_39393 [translate_table: standard]
MRTLGRSSSSSWLHFRTVLNLATSQVKKGGQLKSPWARRSKRRPLSPQQWTSAFLPDGRLVDGGLKVLKKVRSGGIDSSIRAEVWPFLLGVYDLKSSKAERDTEKNHRRDAYESLRRQCQFLQTEGENEGTVSEATNYNAEGKRLGSQKDDAVSRCIEDVGRSSESISGDLDNMAEKDPKHVKDPSTENDLHIEDEASSDSESMAEDDPRLVNSSVIGKGRPGEGEASSDSKSVVEDNPNPIGSSVTTKDMHIEAEAASDNKPRFDRMGSLRERGPQALEDFSTWQRIIRLDAVRMNAEWVPYSPSQANVTEEEASWLARHVGLKDDEHLEPCRKHHAARLVAILEAYALYDPETGYCQGMSDLLSPFVALMDEDYEAFWCFAHFMHIARHNFRLDEVGIRRQLNMVAKIIKAKDSQLYKHLEKLQAEDCFFVYRMVVVLFRRELTFEQTLCLWDVIWADQAAIRAGIRKSAWRRGKQRAPPTNDLLLYAVAAAVLQKRKLIIENYSGMDDILRECNSMAGHLDIWKLLDDAHDLVVALHDKL